MKKTVPVLAFALVLAIFQADVCRAQSRCTVCHSKSPRVRAMHKAVKDRDCFSCHMRGESLRRKGGIVKERHEAFLKQRLTDPRCTRCHGEQGVHGGHQPSKSHPTRLSGRTYCPRCRIIGDKAWKLCPRCGGPLLDLDALLRQSALNPDDALCRTCHPADLRLKALHRQKAGEALSAKSSCLGCHEGHKVCAGCHQSD